MLFRSRDDLPDGGMAHVAACVHAIREVDPSIGVETLISDVRGTDSLDILLDAGPDVLNHNIETVPRLYRMARSGGRYPRSLELLDRSRTWFPDIATKTGIMVGLGEERDEVLTVFDDLRANGVSILTIGQYLRPSADHAPMTRYYHPDEFADLKADMEKSSDVLIYIHGFNVSWYDAVGSALALQHMLQNAPTRDPTQSVLVVLFAYRPATTWPGLVIVLAGGLVYAVVGKATR